MRLIDVDKINLSKFITSNLGEIKAKDIRDLLDQQPTVRGWIPFRFERDEETGQDLLAGELPDDGQEILIVTKWGVDTDVCGIDEGYYLENRGDWDDVIAWAEMPKYKAGEKNEI